MTKLEKYKAMLMEALLAYEAEPVAKEEYCWGMYQESLKWLRKSLKSIEDGQLEREGHYLLTDLTRLQQECGLDSAKYTERYWLAMKYAQANFIRQGQFSYEALHEPS